MATLTIVPSIDRSSCHARTNGSSRHRQPSHAAFDLRPSTCCLSANASAALVDSSLHWEHLFKAVLKDTSINGFASPRRILRRQASTVIPAQTYTLNETASVSKTCGVGVVTTGGANNAKSSATILALPCCRG